MNRVYKEDTPANTVIKIRNILGELGVVNYESFWGQPYQNVYSVRIDSFETEGCFGTNGKGRNRIFALASGYAEYMERLQNGFLAGTSSLNRFFLNSIKKETGFYFFPDEKFITKEEFKNLPLEYLEDIFGQKDEKEKNKQIDIYFKKLSENGFSGVLSVPFYNIKERKITYLPFNINMMLTGSNGMAAGNSITEGTFQGLCELIERYAASIVFHEQLTPPTVPMEYISQYTDEKAIIDDIEANGYKVIVKDFSCGRNLPVIGVIIIDKKKQKYRLNIGSDTSFPIAISRALTEIHQGLGDKESFEKVLLSVPTSTQEYFLKSDKVSMLKRSIELRKFTIDNSGIFPFALFRDEFSYNFNPESYTPKENYLDEVKGLITLIQNLGKNIYMRNVSFLGFPSYYIYIPQISPIGRKTTEYERENVNLIVNVNTDRIEDLFFPFKKLASNKESLQKIVDILSSPNQKDLKEIKMCELLKLELNPNYYWSSLPVTFFLTLFYYILGEYTLAIEALQVFKESTNNGKDNYYTEVTKYFKLLEKGKDLVTIKHSISSEIINDFSSVENIFCNIDIPNCPDCNNCSMYKNCLTKNKVDFSKRIMNKMKSNLVNQDDFECFIN